MAIKDVKIGGIDISVPSNIVPEFYDGDQRSHLSKKSIELIKCEAGDWKVLRVDGEIYFSGHSVTDDVWLDLLRKEDIEVSEKTISDEDMESRNY